MVSEKYEKIDKKLKNRNKFIFHPHKIDLSAVILSSPYNTLAEVVKSFNLRHAI